jgi:predicted kinase
MDPEAAKMLGLMELREGQPPLPLLVLVSGAPGSGKTTLAGRIADSVGLFHLHRDGIWDGLRFTSARGQGEAVGHGVEVWYSMLALLMRHGVSVVADGTLYRGEDEQNVAAVLQFGEVINLHCHCADSVERYRARQQIKGATDVRLASLMARVESIQDRVTEPLSLGCPSIAIDTTDGYDPPLDQLIAAVMESPAGRR